MEREDDIGRAGETGREAQEAAQLGQRKSPEGTGREGRGWEDGLLGKKVGCSGWGGRKARPGRHTRFLRLRRPQVDGAAHLG